MVSSISNVTFALSGMTNSFPNKSGAKCSFAQFSLEIKSEVEGPERKLAFQEIFCQIGNYSIYRIVGQNLV